ncbi:MAG: hypothetical protein U0797_00995 [Gemmataceae bacterium]
MPEMFEYTGDEIVGVNRPKQPKPKRQAQRQAETPPEPESAAVAVPTLAGLAPKPAPGKEYAPPPPSAKAAKTLAEIGALVGRQAHLMIFVDTSSSLSHVTVPIVQRLGCYSKVLAESAVAQRSIVCSLLQGDVAADVVSVKRGGFAAPEGLVIGSGTMMKPWLEAIAGTHLAWREHARASGCRAEEGLAIIITDAEFHDWDAEQAAAWGAWMERHKMVALVATIGHEDEACADRLCNQGIRSVPLDRVGLEALFNVLRSTLVRSVGGRGVLAGELKRAFGQTV